MATPSTDDAALIATADIQAMPDHLEVLCIDRLKSRPMKTDWVAGQRVGFDLRARPTRRLSAPMARPVGRHADRHGAGRRRPEKHAYGVPRALRAGRFVRLSRKPTSNGSRTVSPPMVPCSMSTRHASCGFPLGLHTAVAACPTGPTSSSTGPRPSRIQMPFCTVASTGIGRPERVRLRHAPACDRHRSKPRTRSCERPWRLDFRGAP